MSEDTSWMDEEEKEEAPKETKREPIIRQPKRIITVSLVLDEIVKKIDIHEIINPDEMQLRKILTAPRGNLHRNETYQRRQIVRPLIEFLIKQGWICLK